MLRMLAVLAPIGLAMASWFWLRASDGTAFSHTVWAVSLVRAATPILVLFAGDAVVRGAKGQPQKLTTG